MTWHNHDYYYRQKVTIDHNKIDANLTDFPILISLTDNDLRVVTSGGHVRSSDGYDICFYTTAGAALHHEIEAYDGGTGTLAFWVKVPSILAASDTEIYMYYGKYGIAADPSSTDTWNVNHVMVQHMNDATTSSILDSTSNDNDGTKKGANEPIEASAKIAEGQDFDGANDFVDCGNDVSLCFSDGSTDESFSVEAWINMPDVTDTGVIVSKYNDVIAGGKGWLFIMAARRIAVNAYDDDANGYIGRIFNTAYGAAYNNIWMHMVFTYDGSGISAGFKIYVDGVRVDDADTACGVYTAMDVTTATTDVGRRRNAAGATELVFNGSIDEVRISNIVRSPAWIRASYENQNTPAGFESFDAEEMLGDGCYVKYYDGANTITLATTTELDTEICRMYNGTATVALVLVDPSDPMASEIMFYDGATTLAYRKCD